MHNTFFIHIPKTGGTSLRKALEESLEDSKIIKNYGMKSPETHHNLRPHLNKPGYAYWLRSYLEANENATYIGHVSLNEYLGVFPYRNIITMVRDPIAQVTSHYNHFKRWLNYEGSFEDFVAANPFQNVQARHLKSAIPVNLIGFLGINEEFADSIAIINKFFDTNLVVKNENTNSVKEVKSPSEEQIDLIKKHNSKDIALYNFAKTQFAELSRIVSEEKVWVYGGYHINQNRVLAGYAYFKDNDNSVTVLVKENGEIIKELKSNIYRAALLASQPSKHGFIGFQYKIPDEIDPNSLSIEVKETSQTLLPNHTIA